MRGSLFVLYVRLLRPADTAVGKLRSEDLVAAVAHLVRTSPVPVHSADELEAGDFLISEVSNDLQHLTTVAIETEDLQVQKTGSVDSVLEEKGANSQTSNEPLGVLNIVPNMSLHFI